ncbi:hypothetical protein MMC12_001024 [Toensbergia leucococca]|nr:hypothetical protein [Toensbergia leucococca]
MNLERTSCLTSPNVAWFPVPSLYASLQDESINLLETCFALVVTGAFFEADRAYEGLPQQLRHHCATVLGRSIGLLQQWRFKDAYLILQEALLHGPDGRSYEEYLLIRILFAYVSIKFKGSFVQARDCMRELRLLIKNVPMQELKDIQVRGYYLSCKKGSLTMSIRKVYCLREYLRLVHEASNGSPNFNTEPLLGIVASSEDGLQGVADFRAFLQLSGRWREASLVQDFEEDLCTDVAQKVGTIRSLLASMDTSFRSVPWRLLRASKHLVLANFCDEQKRQEQAEIQILQAEQLSRDQNGTPHPFLHKVIRLCKLKIDASSIHMTDAEAAIQIADSAEAEGLHRAECIALQLVNSILTIRRPVSLSHEEQQLEEVRERLEHRLSELGNIQDFYGTAILHHHLLGEGCFESLEWWKQVDIQYPNYNVWQHRITRQIELSRFHVNNDEYVQALEARQRAEDLLKDSNLFWAPCLVEGQLGTSFGTQDGSATLGQPRSLVQRRSAARKSEPLETYFFEDYQKRNMIIPDPDTGRLYYGMLGTDSIGARKAPFETLLAWILADLEIGELLPTQFDLVFGLCLGEISTDDFVTWIKSLTASHFIVLLYGPLNSPVPCERWLNIFSVFQTWLVNTESFPKVQQQYMLVELQNARIERISTCSAFAAMNVEECRRGLELVRSLDFVDSSKDAIRLFEITCQTSFAHSIGISWLGSSSWSVEKEEDFTEAMAVLRQALSNTKPNADSFRGGHDSSTDAFICGSVYFALGILHYSKFEAGGGIDVDNALTLFRFAEKYFRMKRERCLSKHGFKPIESYLKALENPLVDKIFPTVIQMQSTANTAQLHVNKIWEWLQAAKCRGLGSLGRFSKIESQYTDAFLSSEDNEGAGFGVENLRVLSLLARSPVVFIDWYTDFHGGKFGVPIMSTLRPGGIPRLFKFEDEVDLFDLNVYKRHFVSALEREQSSEGDETRESAHWLQKFEGLIRPVFEISDPGDVLVFSPCGLLHGIPLHAVLFDEQPLIRRNPIVYTTSMKSLFYAALARQTDMAENQSLIFRSGVFINPPSTQGRKSAENVASILNVDPRTEADFTKAAFMTSITEDADLLHYHAHATAPNHEPLEQSLEFSDAPLSVREILEIVPRRKSYHATILGCSSGVTVKTTSNEPLGLVPALMYNGASSVISALWPIDDHDAALFANEFYSNFSHNLSNQEGGPPETRIIDLARAAQRAVLSILDSEQGRNDLRHWAGNAKCKAMASAAARSASQNPQLVDSGAEVV